MQSDRPNARFSTRGDDNTPAGKPLPKPDIKLPLLLLLCLMLIIAGGGYLVFQQLQRNEMQTAQQSLAAIANLKASEINRWIAQNKTNAIIASRGSPVADRTRNWLDTGAGPGADLDWLNVRLEGLRQIHSYGEMAIMDASGKPLLSTEPILPDVADLRPLFDKALAAGEPVVGEMRWNRMKRGNPYIAVSFAAPLIATGPEKRVVGILLIQADANQFLFPLVMSWPTPSKTAETFIARQDGDDLLILSELRNQPGSALNLRVPIALPDRLVSKAFRSEEGILRGIDYRNEPAIGYGTRIPGTDWVMVAKVDEKEVFASTRKMAAIVTATALVLLLASSLMLYLWWRQRYSQYRAAQLQAELNRQFITSQYEILSKYANDIILLFDRNYAIVDANDRAEAALGYSRSELIGMSLLDIVEPKDRRDLDRRWKEILENRSLIFAFTHVRSDGSAFPVEASTRVIEKGDQVFVQSIMRDITERKHAEEALQQALGMIEGITQASADTIAALDSEFRFLFVNEAYRKEFKRLWGRDVEVGLSLIDVLAPWPEDLDKAYGLWHRALRGESFSVTAEFGRAESRQTYDLRFNPIYGAQGQQIGAAHIASNVTERERMQDALKESEERYRNLFIHMTEGFALCEVIFDGSGKPVNYRFLDINDGFTQQTGLSRERMIGKIATDALPRLEPIWIERFNHVGITGEPLRFTEYNADTQRSYEINCYSPSYGRFAFLARDITSERHNEAILRENEARFRQLADAMPQLVWTADPDGTVDYYNERYQEYSGFRKMENGAFEWAPVLHPDDLEATVKAWDLAVKTGEMYQIEHRVMRAGGSYHWHISRALPAKNERGEVTKWYGTATDIHGLKLAQEEAQRNEERLRLTQMATRIGTFEWDIQRNVNVWSPEAEALYGLSPGSFSGTYEAWVACVHPDDRIKAEQDVSEALETGEYESEWRVIWPDGRVRWLAARGLVIKDESGMSLRMIGVNIDITERKKAEEGRTEALRQLETVMENLAEGVITFDGKGNVLSMNGTALALHGFSDFEQARRHLAEFEHEFDLSDSSGKAMPLSEWPLARVLQGERFTDLEVRVRQKKTGKEKYFAYSGSPIADEKQKVYLGVLTLRDITESKRSEEELKLAALVYQESAEAMMVTDEGNRIVATNPAFERLTGFKAEEVLGKNPLVLSSGIDSREHYREMLQKLTQSNYWQGELWLNRKNGERFAAGMTINTTFHPDGSVSRHVALFSDITERKQAEEVVWQQANFDPLTNLPNRRHFLDQLRQEIRKSRRSHRPFALMFMDLDGFKSVNDTLGHEAGDQLLKETAERLSGCVRETDMVARLGGDEFIIILSELRNTRHVEKVARHILHKLSDPFDIGGEIAHVSGSIGITIFPQDASNMDDLLINADNAMYSAKDAGKNRYSYFTEAMQKAAQERMWLANELRVAIEGRQFRLVYQPIVELSTGCINKAEALLRWHHPERGEIDPSVFIPVAEDTGMIQEIGDWVFFEAASQVAKWRQTYHPDFQISINKSPVQFKSKEDDLAAWFDYLRTLNLPGQSIAVEITEGVLMDESQAVINQLLAFRDAGIEVSLDDFGTGYSTLSYLKRFDIDRLKIDRTFIRDLETDTDDQALCEAMIVMGHKLGIKVIAEGVETDGQREFLARAGCDFAQGFLLSTPISAEGLDDFLKAGASYCPSITPMPAPGAGPHA